MSKIGRRIIKKSGLFDERYYLRVYPDVRQADIDPIEHYILFGAKEGRNPSPYFDTKFYLEKYPDVAQSGMNPLLHYILLGRYEGRYINNKYIQPPMNDSFFIHRINTLKKLIGLLQKDPTFIHSLLKKLKKGSLADVKRFIQEKMHLEYYIGDNCHMSKSKDMNKEIKDDVIGILTTQHTMFVAHLLQHALQRHSRKAHIILQQDFQGKFEYPLYIVIAPQVFSVLPPLYIAFQMEQSVSSRWFTQKYFDILENSLAIFEYSMKNINFLLSNNISYKQIFYMPISYFDNYPDYLKTNGFWDGQINSEFSDVLFYGDPNSPRRKMFLEALKKRFKIKVLSEVFGNELYRELMSTKLVVNIHYYEGALLETTRIYECLSLGIPVVSETSVDIDEYPDLKKCVEFVEMGNIDAMINAVERLLSNENLLKEKREIIKEMLSKKSVFNFYFDRFLVAHGLLPFSSMLSYVDTTFRVPENKMVCISLPESYSRRQSFLKELKDNNLHIEIFDGIRHKIGWIGCGLSIKFLMHAAIKNNVEYLIVCEDDVELYDGFWEKLHKIVKYLKKTKKQWHIFSGMIADVHYATEILDVEQYEGIEFIYINKMTSTVFNIYHKSIFKIIADWNETNTDVNTNTIDRFLESQNDIVIVTTLPYLVGHKEEHNSILWGFNNSQYKDMISKSIMNLSKKVEKYKVEKYIKTKH